MHWGGVRDFGGSPILKQQALISSSTSVLQLGCLTHNLSISPVFKDNRSSIGKKIVSKNFTFFCCWTNKCHKLLCFQYKVSDNPYEYIRYIDTKRYKYFMNEPSSYLSSRINPGSQNPYEIHIQGKIEAKCQFNQFGEENKRKYFSILLIEGLSTVQIKISFFLSDFMNFHKSQCQAPLKNVINHEHFTFQIWLPGRFGGFRNSAVVNTRTSTQGQFTT